MSDLREFYSQPDLPRMLHPEPPPDSPRRGDYVGMPPVIAAAARAYEEAWPDRIWATAPEAHQRVWIEVMAVHYVAHTGPFAEERP